MPEQGCDDNCTSPRPNGDANVAFDGYIVAYRKRSENTGRHTGTSASQEYRSLPYQMEG